MGKLLKSDHIKALFSFGLPTINPSVLTTPSFPLGTEDQRIDADLTAIGVSILNWIFLFITIATVFYLIWAGYRYITSAGDSKKAGEARKAILAGIIGIVVVAATYFIINLAAGTATLIRTNVDTRDGVTLTR